MIIKLEDSDITTAQDDSEDRGVIHVPDETWNHVIKEVEHQDQEWVNSLYLDVGSLSIGGSGLPILIYSFRIGTQYTANTWDMTLKEANEALTIQVPDGYGLLQVVNFSQRYGVSYLINKSGSTQNYTFSQQNEIRYYLTPSTVSTDYPMCYFYNHNSDEVFCIMDMVNSDNEVSHIRVIKEFIEFLWINN